MLAETRRIDTGRLGIPVYLSVCGEAARAVMPTRKQMGKGASPEQAEASALMELARAFQLLFLLGRPEPLRDRHLVRGRGPVRRPAPAACPDPPQPWART